MGRFGVGRARADLYLDICDVRQLREPAADSRPILATVQLPLLLPEAVEPQLTLNSKYYVLVCPSARRLARARSATICVISTK